MKPSTFLFLTGLYLLGWTGYFTYISAWALAVVFAATCICAFILGFIFYTDRN
jgi:hypothetical protein